MAAGLDEAAEAWEGWTGPLKLGVCGPWTLAATLELPRGERVVSDPGATRDLVGSLAAGVADRVAEFAALVPGAEVVVQVDEPALPAVLAGQLPTQSGVGTVPAIDASVVRDGLRGLLDAVGGRRLVLHSCHQRVPIDLLRDSGVRELAVDTTVLPEASWDRVAEFVEAGGRLWAGVVPTAAPPRTVDPAAQAARTPSGGGTGHPETWREPADRLLDAWRRLGLPTGLLREVIVTPACGLAALTPAAARDAQRTAIDVAAAVTERSE